MRFELVEYDFAGRPSRIVLRPHDVHPETLAELLRLYKRDFSELCISPEGDLLVFTGGPLGIDTLPKACLRFAHYIEGRMRLVGWIFTAPYDNRRRPKSANLLRPTDLVCCIVPTGDRTPEDLFTQLKTELAGENRILVELTQIGVRINFTYIPDRLIPAILKRRSPQLLAAMELGGYL